MSTPNTDRLSMEREPRDLLLAFSVCPLLAISDTMSKAIGFAIAILIILPISRILTLATARVLSDAWQVAASMMVIVATASAVLMLMQARLPWLYEALSIFPLLLATNAAVGLRFNDADATPAGALMATTKVGLQIAVLSILLGIVRELVGRGSIFHDAGNQFGDWARSLQLFRADMGFLLAMLPPGAFISLGLILAARNWFVARRHE